MPNETNRRDFMKMAAGAGAAVALTSVGNSLVFGQTAQNAQPAPKTISMLKLPYPENALEPSISGRTVHLHYNKHHQSYYTLLKAYIDSHPEYQNMTLEELIRKHKNGILLDEDIFNLSVLLDNHNRYWPSLKPKGGGVPKGTIEKMIAASYGSFEGFRKAFSEEAGKPGIGWVWVVQDGDKVKAYRTDYHDTPLVKGYTPLLAVDIWEHAYYLDYQDERSKYIDAVLTNLLDWDFAEKNLTRKKK